MNKSSKLLVLIVTVFLLAGPFLVECRRTYSSRSSSSGRGNRGKNQPSGGGLFSSWFGGSKTSSSGSGSISKPAPTSSKKNWQTATSHATSQSKPSSGWANPYYKPSGSAAVPSAPRESNYGWKTGSNTNTNTKPVSSYPSSNIGSRGYPVQSGVSQGSQSSFGGYKPASGVPSTNYQPAQSSFGGYRPASSVPGTHNTGFQPVGHQNNYGGYHSAPNYHPSQQSHGYQPSYHPSANHYPTHTGGFSGYHPSSYTGYSPHTSFGGAQPSYQGTKLFGGNTGHYSYPGSGSWGIDTYGARKSSSGTGKLLTGLAVGAAGGYLTSSLVNRISNPWKYSGYGYGSSYNYGPSYDWTRSRDESAFERGYERGIQARLNENNNNNNNNNNNKDTNKDDAQPEDPSRNWVQCVAFDPQTQQTLINPNCSCTVTTSVDERTGQPLSVHHCTTLNGLVMQPVPIQPSPGNNLPPISGQTLEGVNVQPTGGVNSQPAGSLGAPGPVPSYGAIYEGNFNYGGGATVYIPPQSETKVEPVQTFEAKPESYPITDKSTTESKTEQSATEAKPEKSTSETRSEIPTGTVIEQAVTAGEKIANVESVGGGIKGETPPIAEELGGGLQDRKRTSEFFGQLQKIVNMGNFVDGG